MGLFSWNSKQTPEPEMEKDIESGSAGIMGRISQLGDKISQKTESTMESYQNMQIGILMMVTGGLFMFLSTFFIPLIPIRPSKFICLNAFGNICIVSSLFLIRGTKYIKTFLAKDKLLFSMCYVLSLIGEIYFAFLHSSYLYSILCFLLNFISLAYILFSFFKNGTTVLNYFFKTGFGCVKSVIMKIFSRKSGGEESIMGV